MYWRRRSFIIVTFNFDLLNSQFCCRSVPTYVGLCHSNCRLLSTDAIMVFPVPEVAYYYDYDCRDDGGEDGSDEQCDYDDSTFGEAWREGEGEVEGEGRRERRREGRDR